jgi:hypothetical protein
LGSVFVAVCNKSPNKAYSLMRVVAGKEAGYRRPTEAIFVFGNLQPFMHGISTGRMGSVTLFTAQHTSKGAGTIRSMVSQKAMRDRAGGAPRSVPPAEKKGSESTRRSVITQRKASRGCCTPRYLPLLYGVSD